MTRFARAHGSKASNERQPEEATPWSTFKQQLMTQSAPERTNEDCSQSSSFSQKEQNIETQWAEFDNDAQPENHVKKKMLNKTSQEKLYEGFKKANTYKDDSSKTSKKKKRDKSVKVGSNVGAVVEEISGRKANISESIITKNSKKKKRVKSAEAESRNVCVDSKFESEEKTAMGSKQRKIGKKKWCLGNNEEPSELCKEELGDGVDNKRTKLDLKRKRSSLKRQSSDCHINESASELNCPEKFELSEKTKLKNKKEKNKQKKRNENQCDSVQTQQLNSCTDNHTNQQAGNICEKKSKRQKRNLKNLNKDFPVKNRRQKKLIQVSTVMVDGEEVQVTKFNGFPIRAQDAERLLELHKQLIAQGLPPADIARTLKFERRKSEKALAREKRNVCFHCRKGGHNLSECPQLNEGVNQDAVGIGICFKCGSTEHTHFQCRVVRTQEFRFAKCFICQEQGHISRQCPDNPRGLYPKGGACRVCGDVTHLKKDCPDLQEKKEKSIVTLSTVRGDKIEALDEDLKSVQQSTTNTPKNKIIKF